MNTLLTCLTPLAYVPALAPETVPAARVPAGAVSSAHPDRLSPRIMRHSTWQRIEWLEKQHDSLELRSMGQVATLGFIDDGFDLSMPGHDMAAYRHDFTLPDRSAASLSL